MKPLLLVVGLSFALVPQLPLYGEIIEADICIFGASSGGIAAAIQASRMGHSVVIAEPGRFIGGLTTGGLSATDIGNKAAIGGISREFYGRIARHYAQDSAWKYETRAEYFSRRGGGQAQASNLSGPDATMWTFEPHVADETFSAMLREANVPVYFDQTISFVRKDGTRITELVVDNSNTYRAKVYIDATYEGDLMAKSDVSYHVGRESNREYGETLNGFRDKTPKHQFTVDVDPYRKPGVPDSGLLPFIQGSYQALEGNAKPGSEGDDAEDATETVKAGVAKVRTISSREGDGDSLVQTYNYRLCFTTNAANRLPVEPPPGYDPAKFELLARYLEALVAAGKKPKLSEFWNPIWMPNQKTDINNNGGFSTDFIGANWEYPEADYKVRERIAHEHEEYTRGFITFLATSPRVPENIRDEMKRWGPCKDEFNTTDGWPNQLYVREARRMIANYVMNENHCRGTERAEDSIGLAAYNMDSHNVQRFVRNGRVENEGDVQVPPMRPYPISYRAIVPKPSEARNLLVPVCLSASHIAYGSIRMEPVFMILGQSAATAASLAIKAGVPVQKVDYSKLRTRLLADRQILEWPAAKANPPVTKP